MPYQQKRKQQRLPQVKIRKYIITRKGAVAGLFHHAEKVNGNTILVSTCGNPYSAKSFKILGPDGEEKPEV